MASTMPARMTCLISSWSKTKLHLLDSYGNGWHEGVCLMTMYLMLKTVNLRYKMILEFENQIGHLKCFSVILRWLVFEKPVGEGDTRLPYLRCTKFFLHTRQLLNLKPSSRPIKLSVSCSMEITFMAWRKGEERRSIEEGGRALWYDEEEEEGGGRIRRWEGVLRKTKEGEGEWMWRGRKCGSVRRTKKSEGR